MVAFFYTLNILLLLSGLLTICTKTGERRYSLALVQSLFALPLLAGEYCYLAYHLEVEVTNVILFSEIVFGLIWLSMNLHLHRAATDTRYNSKLHCIIEMLVAAGVVAATLFFLNLTFPAIISVDLFSFSSYGFVYVSAVFLLIVVLYGCWRLEQFWRRLSRVMRWEYKFFVVGSFLISGSLAWSSSYRLSYLTVFSKHLLLLAILLVLGWAMMVYAVVHHRLLNRKIFVSRKVVNAFVIPSLLATYLLGFGLVLLIMRTLGQEMSFVLTWLLVALGLVATGLFAFSGKIRRRVQFYISTHFYNNKYEYRDEWLALSQELQGASNENEVVQALREVLAESLYTTDIFIWLGGSGSSQDYKLVSFPASYEGVNHDNVLSFHDPLIEYLKSYPYFHLEEKEPETDWQEVLQSKKPWLYSFNITLLAPISIGNQLVGLIGLGPEYTGGRYSYDDFDLLAALGSQTASALLAIRMAEELALAREQQAWNRLSAFVLHDIKNAATMLSLLQENAPEHIHEPEFQQDMLELVDDSLKRMARVEQRLQTLKDEITPELKRINLWKVLDGCCCRLEAQLPTLEVKFENKDDIEVISDPVLLCSILENLLLNSKQASRKDTIVKIKITTDENSGQVFVELSDNGPGIPGDLLPDALFEPFKTSKEGGSGIGLWQVKKMITSLGGNVSAKNNPEGGACFVLVLPQNIDVV
ncbi:XrtA/PEP-CTERM system histidine kinase PrsK [Desulforhopalus sp. IMCC35007]|uniref:XrtA/PEP-CTERM system histidine kinase PrsK n=1 Tax=Desulforhopalus sp. IMCC35007 TaxID=2569543 RepID=UPI0010ADEE3A|nr:XrtA/PEP-CTERM system histidine kinase PrsK [Desulforhopalus sp. IMCC35007]TKB12411.1 PEP-CTERM system histidine kinase PrsK [Desulforhopalus sp. IMCC35007]